MEERLKLSVLQHAARGEVDVVTDRRASPTGYPFKLVRWSADPAAEVKRERVCDIAGLRVAYRKADGAIGYRCPAEPVEAYRSKGGRIEETEGRMCLCNGLMATAGVAQVRPDGTVEPPIVTSGDDLKTISRFLAGRSRYSASDVIDYLRPA
jgi:NAD(P)H-dependent flavin oxidoreductase YrpB (nitropropane dioxygenase family)